jgi:peptidoglycan/LPS O-acetylase OafA/YrhL
MLSTESRTETSRAGTVPERRLLRSRTDTRDWLQERIDGRVALAVGIAWLVLNEIAYALEPAAQQSVPVIGIVLELTMYVLLAAMLTGLVMQRRWGFLASLGAAVLATAASIACPITGHHAFGTWWFGQMACMLALVAISAVTLRRSYS